MSRGRLADDGYAGGSCLLLRKRPTVTTPPDTNMTRPNQRLQSSAAKKRPIPQVVSRYLESDEPFDRWFAETVLTGTHGMDASQEPPPANEVFVDWSA